MHPAGAAVPVVLFTADRWLDRGARLHVGFVVTDGQKCACPIRHRTERIGEWGAHQILVHISEKPAYSGTTLAFPRKATAWLSPIVRKA